jgi:hypothetical protein
MTAPTLMGFATECDKTKPTKNMPSLYRPIRSVTKGFMPLLNLDILNFEVLFAAD